MEPYHLIREKKYNFSDLSCQHQKLKKEKQVETKESRKKETIKIYHETIKNKIDKTEK